MARRTILLAALAACIAVPAAAAPCGNTAAGFPAWKKAFSQEAIAAGIGARTVEAAIGGLAYSERVVSLDRNQSSFKRSFEEFYRRRTSNAMIARGRTWIRSNPRTVGKIERYGVPAELVVAIWALETGFGGSMGDLPIFRSLATLAYDCRRAAFFTNELMAALKIVDRGDIRLDRMVGAWAGEIGQTQFLAERYLNYAVDGDGDGRRDLYRSAPDALVSTANWFARNGWRAGAPWGPGTGNFEVIGAWNRAEVYKRTIARLAEEMGS